MNITEELHAKAVAIEYAALSDPLATAEHHASYWLALACALLTSPVKAEREAGKALVREYRRAGVSHANADKID